MSWTKPQKTSFLNISKISAGYYHSLFQNETGELFACGYNFYGQCGLGLNDNKLTPSRIPNAPPNIVEFVCGFGHSLFIDSEGNVYSVGNNEYGELGLGHNTSQNVLSKIVNIPIQTISCVRSSSYLIDFEGNLWTFGYNYFRQLGHDDETNINTPKVSTLKDIQQISHGSCGNHFIAKNSQNRIFIKGRNDCGQLGTGDTRSLSIFKKLELNSQYSTIWRDKFYTRTKSARK